MTAPATDAAGIRQTIETLKAAGYTLVEVWDGGEEMEKVTSTKQAIDAITAVDDATLFVRTPEGDYNPWVRFVMGNDPEEVICDHHTGLSDVLDPLMDKWSEGALA